MFHYFKKLILSLMFFCNVLPLMYAMENAQQDIKIEKANTALLNSIKTAPIDWKKIEHYIPFIDPQLKIKTESNDIPLLALLVEHEQEDLVHALLQRGADPNNTTNVAALYRFLVPLRSYFPKAKEIKTLENSVIYNDSYWTPCVATPLELAIRSGNYNIVKILINHRANVNQADSRDRNLLWCTLNPLHQITKNSSLQIIRELCEARAQITTDNIYDGGTLFHSLAYKIPKNFIETIITHAHPTCDETVNTTETINDKQYLESREKIILVFRMFTQYKLPSDIRVNIYSKLLSENDFVHPKLRSELSYNRLCRKLDTKNAKFWTQVKNRITWLQTVLQKKDKKGKTAAQLLNDKKYQKDTFPFFENNDNSVNQLLPLFNGSNLTNDYIFLIENPHLLNSNAQEAKQNLACQIAKNIIDSSNSTK